MVAGGEVFQVVRVNELRERLAEEVFGFGDWIAPLQVGRGADRPDFIVEQAFGIDTRPFAFAEADSEVNAGSCQVVDRGRGDETQFDFGMGGAETGEARHQPVGGESDAGCDGEFAWRAVAADVGGDVGDVLQTHGDGTVQSGAFRRQFQPLGPPLEQGGAEMVFQRLDLPADGALGHLQLFGRPGEVQMPCSSLENDEAVGWRQGLSERNCHEKM